jgi:hypothetical protein
MKSSDEKNVREKDAVLAWMDLSYHYANRIFEYLVEEGLVQDDNSQQSLNAFLEIVTFVYCRVEMEIQRRLFGQRLKDLRPVFYKMRAAWGSFFVDYPEGSRLEHASAEAVSDAISKRWAVRHASYSSDLRTHGALHAMRSSCAVLIRDIGKNRTAPPPGKTLPESLDDPERLMVRHVEELTYSLNRDVSVLLAHQTL